MTRFLHLARGVGGPRRVRLRQRAARRHLRAQGARVHRRRPRDRGGRGARGRAEDHARSAPGTARSCTRPCSAARRWSAPRTAATTTASRSTPARSTTACTSTRATSARTTSEDYTSHNTERLDTDAVVALLRSLPEFSVIGARVKVAVTGAAGFLGWHVRCALKARGGHEVRTIDRPELGGPGAPRRGRRRRGRRPAPGRRQPRRPGRGCGADNERLARRADRGPRPQPGPARRSCTRTRSRPATAPPSARQAQRRRAPRGVGPSAPDAAGGRRPAAQPVRRARPAALQLGRGHVLPRARRGRRPRRSTRTASCRCCTSRTPRTAARARRGTAQPRWSTPAGRPMTVSALLDLLTGFRDAYATRRHPGPHRPVAPRAVQHLPLVRLPGAVPDPPDAARGRARRRCSSALRARGGPAQVFCSTTRPGRTRGEHFHLRKVERFLVLHGTAEIALRRLFDDEIVRFEVSGDRTGDHRHADDVGALDHQHRHRGAHHPVLGRRAARPRPPRHLSGAAFATVAGVDAMKVMTVVGTRPELIRLSRVIARLDAEIDHVLVHTGQNWDPQLQRRLLRRAGAAPARPLARRPGHLARRGPRRRAVRRSNRCCTPSGRTPCSCSATRTPASPRSWPSAWASRCSTWRPATGASTRTCRRRPTGASSTTPPTSTSATPSTPGATCSPRGCPPGGSSSPARRWARCWPPTANGSRRPTSSTGWSWTPGEYYLVSMHREENVDDPERLATLTGALSGLARDTGRRVVVSTHPRLRARLDARRRTGSSSSSRSATSTTTSSSATPAACSPTAGRSARRPR